MFIPYRVDVPFNHRPVANWLAVALVLLVFALQMAEFADYGGWNMSYSQHADYLEKAASQQFVLHGLEIKGLFGHMWLHAGLLHLIGNLIFLWLFGNAVCSKIGNLLYLPIYIALGLVAAISYLIVFDTPMLGASGAINGVVGMYLVFFPENSISCILFVFYRPIHFSVRSFWMILLWFAFDILGLIQGGGNVAFIAHVAGFLAGFALAVLLLKTKLIDMARDEKSIFELVGLEKTDAPPESRNDLPHWQQEWSDAETHPDDDKQQTQTEELSEPQAALFETQEPPKHVIRFACPCGQHVKMPGKYAGLTGRCPKCSARLEIPAE